MEFGEWLLNIRKEMNLDVRSLADITGVDSSTISRTENLQTQTTLYTAFRISEGIGIPLIDLIEILEGTRLSSLERSSFIENDNVFTLQNIDKAIDDFSTETYDVETSMANHLNYLLKETQSSRIQGLLVDELISYDENDVYRFLYEAPLSYRPDMKYPLHIDPNTILYSYKRRGALMVHDADVYANRVQPNKIRTRLSLGSSPLSRVGSGSSLERIKFSDVLQYDIEAEQNGNVIGMYWEACRFYARFTFTSLNPNFAGIHSKISHKQPTLFAVSEIEAYTVQRKEWIIRLAVMIMVVYRWYQSLKGKEVVFHVDQ